MLSFRSKNRNREERWCQFGVPPLMRDYEFNLHQVNLMSLPLEGNFQTILITEDNPDVLRVVSLILKTAGFTVLTAVGPSEATSIAQDYTGTIHLLLSDVDMPGMIGTDLATNLKEKRPDLHVILMSGHDDGALLVRDHGWRFIRKPFVPETLVAAVKHVLEGESHEQTTDKFYTRK